MIEEISQLQPNRLLNFVRTQAFMETLYLYSTVIGGTLMVAQLAMSLLGMHHDVDVDMQDLPDSDIGGIDDPGDHGAGRLFVGIFSFRAVVAAMTVFGCVGMGTSKKFPDAPMNALFLALLAGSGVLYLVGWAVRAMHQMGSDGTVNIEEVIGESGTVYLTVPGQKSGSGKVSVIAQDRTMEYQAVTSGSELATGVPVTILSVISPGVLEVASATEPENIQA